MEVGDGVYDDGEWISWKWINEQLHQQEVAQASRPDDPELALLFRDLVASARAYHQLTGRYLEIWGELGELYAEVKYGLKRHKPHTMGSDGSLGNELVEVKTISPENGGGKVHVKRAGNFTKLLVVRIGEGFSFESRLIDRKHLSEGTGTHARVSWSALQASSDQSE